ncbi:hypothetical protein [Paenibacillus sp. FSL H8-0034]|uniref:hypothetical protein n=1 Tax=Paenibacillus sp. FSL H8-0034 TaxID=2954671 RepID=UPI0030F6D36E
MDWQNQTRIAESIYKGWSAVTMESAYIQLVIIPELGGKIVSLQYKNSRKEWLAQTVSRELKKLGYGSVFTAADMSGWDECFPTIVACDYPIAGAFSNLRLPDHGELWAIPWTVDIQDQALECRVNGTMLPYEFTRRMLFVDDYTVRFDYKVTNRSEETLTVFWTAHPQFVATEHSRICLPSEIQEVLCVDGGRMLEAGMRYPWPSGKGNHSRQLNRVGSAAAKDSRKFYVEGSVPCGWAGIHEANSGEYLTMSWSPDEVPYLGIWIDEGQYNEYSVCALEPSSGYYDSLTEAQQQEKVMVISPKAVSSWSLNIRLGCGTLHEMENN